jgi:hypothetical protein
VGNIELVALRGALHTASDPQAIWEALTASETWMTEVLRRHIGDAASSASKDLVDEVRALSAKLGQLQVQHSVTSDALSFMREHTGNLLDLLGDAWWLKAADEYRALRRGIDAEPAL